MARRRTFAVDGQVTSEKLVELLAVGTEHDALDYKSFLDTTRVKDRIELAKDVAAMQALPDGGYIVIGADNHGNPTTAQGPIKPELFDEANLRSALEKYIDVASGLASQTHEIDSIRIALIYVAPHDDRFTVMKIEGDSGDGKPVFRKGDVFARHGTKSEPWRQADLHAAVTHIRQQEAERVRGEVAGELSPGVQARSVAQGPQGSVAWRLSDRAFTDTLSEAVRAGDRAVTRLAVLTLRTEAASALSRQDSDQLAIILDRLTASLAIGLLLDNDEVFDGALDAFHTLYEQNRATHQPTDRAAVWWDVVTRVEAVGGLAVRLHDWSRVRRLGLHAYVDSPTNAYSSWLRHGFVEAARANVAPRDANGWSAGAALISFAAEHARRLQALHPDLPEPMGSQENAPDPLLDSITQFDFLWCVMAVATGHDSDHYPGFAFYRPARIQAACSRIHDPTVRAALLPGVTASDWNTAIDEVASCAEREALHSGRCWSRPESVSIAESESPIV